jgi:hypothetical protein
MKKLIPILSLILIFFSCGQPQNNVTVSQGQPLDINVSSNNIPGFNVQEFATLLKTIKDPQSLQDAINAPGNKVNNLDLDHDGNIDFLKVVEQQNGQFQVIDEYSNTQSAVVATLTINQQNNTMSVNGNQAYCGSNYQYQSHFSVGDYLLLAYLLRPHPYYISPYHYHSYPAYYHTTVVRRTYVSRPSVDTRNVSTSRSSLSAPTSSQRSFSVRSSSTPVRSGGFGSSRSGSSFGSSRSSFGSSRSSFGGGRHR